MRVFNMRWTPYLLIFFAAGIITASFYYYFLSLAAIVTAVLIIIIFRSHVLRKYIIAASSVFVIGIIITTINFLVLKPINVTSVEIEGRIRENIRYNENYTIVELDNLRIDNKRFRGKANIIIDNSLLIGVVLENGDIITFEGDIVRQKINPYDSISMNYYKRRIFFNGEVSSFINREQGKMKLDERIRAAVFSVMYNSMDDPSSVSIGYALITGDRRYIDSNIRENITDSGIAHIFAVSGMHIGILAASIYYLLRKMRGNILVAMLITSIILIIYAYVCGFTPSVIRAVLMSIMVMYGAYSGRKNDLLSIVSLSALIMLIFSPLMLFEVSFLMSYGAVLGIVFLYKPIARVFKAIPTRIKPIIVSSISVNIMLFPMLCGYFKQFSLYFLFTNIIVLPLLPIIYITLLLGVSINLIIPYIGLITNIAGYLLTAINMISATISSFPYAVIPIGSVGFFAVFYYSSIIITSDYVLLNKNTSGKIMLISLTLSLLGIIYAVVAV